jgi:hypothetical protein
MESPWCWGETVALVYAELAISRRPIGRQRLELVTPIGFQFKRSTPHARRREMGPKSLHGSERLPMA